MEKEFPGEALEDTKDTFDGDNDGFQEDLSWMDGLKKPEADSRPKTQDVTKTKGHKFSDYLLKRELLMGIYEKGFDSPSPVQEQSIPVAIAGRDILARAKNGTGKTASFLIPALQKLDTEKKGIQVLILTPTRELALQTSQVCKELGKYIKGLEVMVTTGGTSLRDDIVRLQQNINVIVATPGRMLDIVEKNIANLSNCEYVAMDEADKLLCPEFQEIIERLIEFLPKKRQIVMFSATFPITVKAFKEKYLNDPVPINLMDDSLTLVGITP
jgi:ATP-dependent RNA helicase DDX6/DHH1